MGGRDLNENSLPLAQHAVTWFAPVPQDAEKGIGHSAVVVLMLIPTENLSCLLDGHFLG